VRLSINELETEGICKQHRHRQERHRDLPVPKVGAEDPEPKVEMNIVAGIIVGNGFLSSNFPPGQ
jgi:hypothetical protein